MDQEGWNRETTCYPTAACFEADPVPEISGYRWRYDIDAAAGAVFGYCQVKWNSRVLEAETVGGRM